MLDWDDLQSFLAVARHGSLSAAARALGVQQTTMGRRLAGLEVQAGVRLLQKTPRGYTLTAAGEAILGNVERIEGETLAIERRITGGGCAAGRGCAGDDGGDVGDFGDCAGAAGVAAAASGDCAGYRGGVAGDESDDAGGGYRVAVWAVAAE